MPIPPYQNDVCTRKDEAEKSMTDDSDPQTVRKEKAIVELLDKEGTTREDRESALPYLDAVPIEDLEALADTCDRMANDCQNVAKRSGIKLVQSKLETLIAVYRSDSND